MALRCRAVHGGGQGDYIPPRFRGRAGPLGLADPRRRRRGQGAVAGSPTHPSRGRVDRALRDRAAAERQAPDAVSGKLAMLGQPQPGLATPSGAPTAELLPLPTPARPSLHRARTRGGDSFAESQPGESWSSLIARGEFAAVVKDAEDRGLDVTLARASAAELTLLADAARYTRRYDVARQALLRVRERFPGSSRSSEAASSWGVSPRLARRPPRRPLRGTNLPARSAQGSYAGEHWAGRSPCFPVESGTRACRRTAVPRTFSARGSSRLGQVARRVPEAP